MAPKQAADVCRSLKNISDEVHHSQANDEGVGIHLIRMTSVVTSTIQLEILKEEETQQIQNPNTSDGNSSQSVTESDNQSIADSKRSSESMDKQERRTLKTHLKALLEIHISKDVKMRNLQNAAKFQAEIPEYILQCNRHMWIVHKLSLIHI